MEKHPNDTYPCPKQEENDNLLPLSSGLVRVYMTPESDSMHSEERLLRQVLSTGTALYHVLSTMKPPERSVDKSKSSSRDRQLEKQNFTETSLFMLFGITKNS